MVERKIGDKNLRLVRGDITEMLATTNLRCLK